MMKDILYKIMVSYFDFEVTSKIPSTSELWVVWRNKLSQKYVVHFA